MKHHFKIRTIISNISNEHVWYCMNLEELNNEVGDGGTKRQKYYPSLSLSVLDHLLISNARQSYHCLSSKLFLSDILVILSYSTTSVLSHSFSMPLVWASFQEVSTSLTHSSYQLLWLDKTWDPYHQYILNWWYFSLLNSTSKFVLSLYKELRHSSAFALRSIILVLSSCLGAYKLYCFFGT